MTCKSDFLEGEVFHAAWPDATLAPVNSVCNIFLEGAPSATALVTLLSSMAVIEGPYTIALEM